MALVVSQPVSKDLCRRLRKIGSFHVMIDLAKFASALVWISFVSWILPER